MNKMRVPLQRVHTCAYCSGKVHIIDPRSYPNDVMAVKDKLGWKCGDCIDNEIKDRIIRVIPDSDRAKEIIAERERESKKRKLYHLYEGKKITSYSLGAEAEGKAEYPSTSIASYITYPCNYCLDPFYLVAPYTQKSGGAIQKD